jgi:carbonic anhydrase
MCFGKIRLFNTLLPHQNLGNKNTFTSMKQWILALTFFLVFTACKQEPVNNDSPLERLMAGNKRFMAGHPVHPDETLQRIRDLKKGQNPFAVIVGCADSRVPPELIFDQGLGDIFSIRTAGNIIGDYELGSIEYAIEHLGCKYIVVLGHENCGAIKAFMENPDTTNQHDHIKNIIEYLNEENEEKSLSEADKHQVDKAVRANILHGVHLLQNSQPVLKPLIDKKEVTVIGAYYDLDNGEVIIIDK